MMGPNLNVFNCFDFLMMLMFIFTALHDIHREYIMIFDVTKLSESNSCIVFSKGVPGNIPYGVPHITFF